MTEITNQITEEVTNQIRLCGTITTPPKFNHETWAERFYEFTVGANRLSRTVDEVKVIVSEKLICMQAITVGERVSIKGQIRTYSSTSKCEVFVFAKEIFEETENVTKIEEAKDINEVELIGYICKEPIYRTTPFGKEITDAILAVNRKYNKSDYVPSIFWGRNAKFVSSLPIGSKLKIKGRLQSRQYQKRYPDGEVETKVAYEVSVGFCEEIL